MSTEELNKLLEKIESYEYKIFDFNREDPLKDFTTINPKENGYYLTIRLGLSGIYTSVNFWMNGNWMAKCADGSTTIARSREK